MPAVGRGGGPGKTVGALRTLRAGERRCRKQLAVSEQGVLLAAERGEFRAGDPGSLDEFELPRDIRIEADEVDSGLWIRRRRIKRLARVDLRAIFATVPHDAMEASRCHRVVLGSGEWPHRCVARPWQRGRSRRTVAAKGQ